VRVFLAGAALLAVSASLAGSDVSAADAADKAVHVVLENARVRVLRASTTRAVADHPEAVVVVLDDGPAGKAGDAYWSGAPGRAPAEGKGEPASLVIVEPRSPAPAPPAAPSTPAAASTEANRAFIGMSFVPLFENERVSVIRGRMDVGAREGFHTHASDIVVVHLSGGVIEDTAEGKTRVNRWTHGDVEFEARGSSHSARNLGAAVDAVLVTLKP
jgi:quercetin dioxygenase-like cupin family protein